MGNFLNNIAAFLASLFVAANDEARRIRNAFVITVISVATVYLTQLTFEDLSATMVVAIICDTVVIWTWFNVRRIVFVAGLGEIIEISGITTHPGSAESIGRAEVPKLNVLFDLYIATALYALFWMHIICFFAPLLSLREYPWFGVFLLFGGTAYLIMYPKGALLRKTLVWGIVLALILMFLRLISPAGWIKFVGTDPFSVMRTSKADRVLVETLSDQKEARDAKAVARLKKIREKIRRGEEISADDEKFIEERKGKGLIQEAFGGIFSSSANAKASPPKTSPAPKKELRQYTIKRPLEFLGAEHVIDRGPGWVKIQKKTGRANFLVANIPAIKGAKYEIVFHAARETTGKTFLKVNQREFCYDIHLSSGSNPIEIAFFRQGEAGNSERFLPAENALQLWADDDLLVQLDKMPYVKITYWQ